jgi:chorismate--pyruvate lyase
MMRSTPWHKSTFGMGPWRTWLIDHGSLTQRLQACCAAFRVLRLRQGSGQPHRDERVAIGLHPGRLGLIREVLLLCGDTPLVFAHTVVPLESLRGPWQALTGLGHRPLGAALFANPLVQRFPLEYRRLDGRHPLHRAATASTGADFGPLWARRSLFALAGHPILVTEVFLPSVLALSERP